ncbi:TPA: cytochrome b [Legionella pneumophila]|uniref:cytochrome b n=1 Tax=Legionella pneumophila TaxID=446 RepID=UPI0007889894|nr:cytochrome b [Legionella pneumophila]HAU1191906.1 cytochrome b [Legionella pneumophila]HBD7101960.1 cytochrome b [Legionella pneumophila]HCO4738466.1 cytochrome b [Legionella pneumophila]HCO4740363.1 cytochrome b [Legionella pneumophila]HEG4431979.1 cytochrome b [Legionella pneumophila]
MGTKTASDYSPLSKLFHWVIAIAVIVMLIAGFFLDEIPEQFQGVAYMLHKSTGITILFLMILRFIWIHANGKPALPASVRNWERFLSRFVQYGFYILLIIMPLSGWIMSVAADRTPSYFGLFQAPLPWIEPNKSLAELMAECHETIAWILIAFITLHILGAIKHHFIDKDNVLRSMLPGKRK